MRRFLFFVFFITCFYTANSAIKIWDGGGDAISWNDPLNWNLDALPLSTDDVILDNSIVVASYSVILPSGAVTVSLNSLTITPTGLNNITLTLPITNSNNPGLDITGTGDALILNNGAILKNSSGASGGTGVLIANTFRINNGGHYIHNTDRGNAALITQLSTVAGTELGEFEFDVPSTSYILSLSGQIFGSLTLTGITNGGTATYIGSGASALNVNGDLNINAGVTLAISMAADFIVHRNYNQASSSTFNLQSSTNNNIIKIIGNIISQGIITDGAATGLPILELNGIVNQSINVTGSITNNVTLRMNNPAGATLLSPLTLPYNLQLTNGKIQTSTTNLLTMIDNATYTGGSSTSFIEGPMKKIGDEDFIFPIGVGSIYTPLGVLAGIGATITDEFTARYFRLSPQSTFGNTYAGGIDHISFVEYWDLVKGSSTISTKRISLTVTAQSFCANIASTFISHLVGGVWSNEPSVSNQTGSMPPYQLGTITTTGDFSVFGPFTLATNLPFNSNPLPIKLITFNATKSNPNAALLKWELASCCSDAAKFEVEKSTDNRTFVAFDKVPGSLTNRFYTLPDNRLSKGITYYRLKMIDEDGTTTYSKIVALINDETSLLITSLWPNPVQSNATISVSVAKAGKVNFTIADLSGKIVKQWNASMTEGNNNIPVNTDGLASGIYHVIAASDNNKIVFRFIKQ